MASSCQKCILGYNYITANKYVILIVKPDTFTDPAAIRDMELPWKLHSRAGPENNTCTYVRSKQP